METLDRLEQGIDRLIEQNRELKRLAVSLTAEKEDWQREKAGLLQEVERILQKLETISLEES